MKKWDKSKILDYLFKNLKSGDAVILESKTTDGRRVYKLFEVK